MISLHLQYLRSNIRKSTTWNRAGIAGPNQSTETKVNQLDIGLPVLVMADDDVLGFYISMNNSNVVEVVDHF